MQGSSEADDDGGQQGHNGQGECGMFLLCIFRWVIEANRAADGIDSACR